MAEDTTGTNPESSDDNGTDGAASAFTPPATQADLDKIVKTAV